jgi:hypothetical protein
VSERSQIVVRLPDVETGPLEELCRFHHVSRSVMVRSLISMAHGKLPVRSDPAELKAPSPLAKELQKRAEVRLRNRRSGLQKVEPPACDRHEWQLEPSGIQSCVVCQAVKG